METIDKCPIETALDYLRNKWSLELIRDLFMGKKRFNEFQKANPKISKNVLSERLKDLIRKGIVEKGFDDKLHIIYRLTDRGKSLNKVLYELAVFACGCGEKEGKYTHSCTTSALSYLKHKFRIEKK